MPQASRAPPSSSSPSSAGVLQDDAVDVVGKGPDLVGIAHDLGNPAACSTALASRRSERMISSGVARCVGRVEREQRPELGRDPGRGLLAGRPPRPRSRRPARSRRACPRRRRARSPPDDPARTEAAPRRRPAAARPRPSARRGCALGSAPRVGGRVVVSGSAWANIVACGCGRCRSSSESSTTAPASIRAIRPVRCSRSTRSCATATPTVRCSSRSPTSSA